MQQKLMKRLNSWVMKVFKLKVEQPPNYLGGRTK